MSPKEKTLNKFKDRLGEGKSILYKDLKADDPSLLYAIGRYFGGILKISQELGITEVELIEEHGLSRNIKKKVLSEEEIFNRLLYLKSIGKLTTSAMRTEFNDLRLETSIKKRYGNVEAGLKNFNLTRDTVRHSKESLVREIHKMVEQGFDMSYTNVITINSKLVSNTTNHFKKGWHSVLDDLEIDYSSKYKKLTKDNISKRLGLIYDKEKTINYPLIQKHDSSILYYVYENYDSIIDFYLDMGIDPNECMDFSKQTVKGFAFERVFAKLLELLQIDFKPNKSFGGNSSIRPDFQLNNGVWIYCKLSAWTSTIEDTIEKYISHCDKLIIVFLRGEHRHLPDIDNERVEFRKIDYYYPFLRQIKRHDLIEEFENISNNDEFLESVTTERLIS